MAFKKLEFQKDWTREADFPTYQDSEEQVRADLQYHPNAVRDFLNQSLLIALEAKTAAENLGAINGNNTAGTIQGVLDAHFEQLMQLTEDIKTVAAGGVPSVVQSSTVTFAAGSWSVVSNTATLIIPKSDHRRESGGFGYNLYQMVDGAYKSGTWGTAATRVTYNSDGSITLTADEAYSGMIVFFGM